VQTASAVPRAMLKGLQPTLTERRRSKRSAGGLECRAGGVGLLQPTCAVARATWKFRSRHLLACSRPGNLAGEVDGRAGNPKISHALSTVPQTR
jgi:hypothetical protein